MIKQKWVYDVGSHLEHNNFYLRFYWECRSMISIILEHNHNVAIIFFLIY